LTNLEAVRQTIVKHSPFMSTGDLRDTGEAAKRVGVKDAVAVAGAG
jgi:hypothetical protein